MPTTNEPNVHVPVSLIERAMKGLLEVPPSSVNASIYGDLHALLSQPTPTTEPHFIDVNELQRQAETDKIGSGENDHGASEALHATALNVLAALSPEQRALQQQRSTERRERNARIFNETATPPSTADMVPGAVRCADSNVNRWYCHRGADGTCPLPKCIDPSTIRDVTPPAMGSADA